MDLQGAGLYNLLAVFIKQVKASEVELEIELLSGGDFGSRIQAGDELGAVV